MMPKQGEAPVERAFVRHSGAFVLHRDPQIDREGLRREGADLRDRVVDRARCQGVGAKRPETAAVSFCDDSPPSGPWIIGYSIPSVDVSRLRGQEGLIDRIPRR